MLCTPMSFNYKYLLPVRLFWTSTRHFTVSSSSSKRHLIFFGSDSFSISVFRELLTQYRQQLSSIETCVVSKNVLFAKYVATYHNDIPIHVWPHLPDVNVEDVSKFALVASFGKLIPESFIQLLPKRILNIHPSLLPRWRGAAPLPRSIMAGDLVVGVSIVQVAPKQFDVGRVYCQQELVPNSEMKLDQLTNTLATTGVRLLVQRVLPDLEKAMVESKEQSELPYRAILAKRLKHTDLTINWSSQTATEITRLFAATLATDHHHKNVTGQLRTTYDGHSIRLAQIDLMPALDVDISSHVGGHEREEFDTKPGFILFDMKSRDRLLIKTRRGLVSVRRLIYKKPMSAQDFFNGYLSKRLASAHYFD